MKKTIQIICLLGLFYTARSFAWDPNAASYLPLQVGNTWVYTSIATGYLYQSVWYNSCKITGFTDTLGHRYYAFENRYVLVSGNDHFTCGPPFYRVRIDSGSMNFYEGLSNCGNTESLYDSLRSRKNDSIWICRSANYIGICYDTSIYSIFGLSLSTKRFENSYGPYRLNGGRYVFAKNFGLVSSHNWTEMQNYCDITLRGCIINGTLYGDTNMLVGLRNTGFDVPESFGLSQNYPNPFNPKTVIRFQVASDRFVSLKVFDALGKEVATLVNEQLQPGTYEADWDGTNYPSGVYFYQLSVGNEQLETKKMLMVK